MTRKLRKIKEGKEMENRQRRKLEIRSCTSKDRNVTREHRRTPGSTCKREGFERYTKAMQQQ